MVTPALPAQRLTSEGSESVLVQREMEKWLSPLANIPPASAGQLGEHRATQVATGELGGG
jgi:hypothetical protein